jgi:hypothetical protein
LLNSILKYTQLANSSNGEKFLKFSLLLAMDKSSIGLKYSVDVYGELQRWSKFYVASSMLNNQTRLQ